MSMPRSDLIVTRRTGKLWLVVGAFRAWNRA